MELLIKNDQGELELNFEEVESIVKNVELIAELKKIFNREIKAFNCEFNEKSQTLDIEAYVRGTLYVISYWTEINLYSIRKFSSVAAMDLLERAGRMVRV